LLASWDPDFLADRLGATLNAFHSAFAWAVHGPASCCIEVRSTGLTHGATNHRSRNGFRHSFPVSTFDRDGLGVRLRNADAVVFRANLLFLHGVVNRVVDVSRTSFVRWHHHGVVGHFLTSFVHWLVDRVVDRLRTSFVHRFLDCVVDHPLVLFVNRLVNGVVDRFRASFVHRFLDCVVDHLFTSFVHRLVDCVVDRALACFVRRYHDRVLNFFLVSLWNHPRTVDHLVFEVHFVPCAVASLFDLLHHSFANGSHHGV